MSGLLIAIEGMKEERNWGAFWLAVGIPLVWFFPSSPQFIVGGILIGALTAALRVWLLTRRKFKLADQVVYVAMAVMLGCILVFPLSYVSSSLWGTLGLGGVTAGLMRLGLGLCETYINRRLTAGILARQVAFVSDDAWKEVPELESIWAQLQQGRRAALRIDEVGAAEPGIARSRLGGAPDLPANFEWPVHEGERLGFLAQIRLDEVAHVNSSLGLPAQGLLSVFYSTEQQPWGYETADKGGCRVFLFPVDELSPAGEPASEVGRAISFRQIESVDYSEKVRSTVWDLERSVPREKWGNFDQRIDAIVETDDHHQLLGYPKLIQGDMDSELAVATRAFGLPEGTPWKLLLQLDSIHELGWCWGDWGFLYFWIPADDLTRGRFDRAWVVLQCT